MTVQQLRRNITADELVHWAAWYGFGGLDAVRDDLTAQAVASAAKAKQGAT